ncbi:hypothetical protein J2X19_000640 [Rhodoferax ferrireducens]|uniref:DUF2993 domain-containing protein n=1 Tax=Rhodoferax ferrireducens TaxID=192843 RepID=A0ABU2C3S6_9BURK|nr:MULTISPECIES: hypothetical protein [Rhodoferax]MDR7375982.1 hypothetical protein [Rhodoferax ferrireducens]SDP87475.1 hypothetical protein SAMN05216303_108185 [Rhodoferax sp. OV413]
MALATDPKRAPLGALLGKAGASLTSAQTDLGLGVGLASGMVMSEATLEIKAAVSRNSTGELEIEPLSSAHLAGALNASAVSTIRVNFVATAATPNAASGSDGTTTPVKNRDEIIKNFRQRDDLLALERVLGPLQVNASFLAGSQRWLVNAVDADGRLVREQLLSD